MQTQVQSNQLKSMVVRNEHSAGSKSACGSSCLSGCMLKDSCVKLKSFQLYFIKNSAISKDSIHHSFNDITHLATLTFSFEIFGAFSIVSLKFVLNLCILLSSRSQSPSIPAHFDTSYRPISFILHEDRGLDSMTYTGPFQPYNSAMDFI